MKTVLVPRAAGFFIGMHVAWQLLAQGHSVFVANPNVP
jgi:nucleoside-diphosphate-sugar epimerase